MEVLALKAVVEGRGIGTALLKAAEGLAAEAGCSSIRLCTTNDNIRAFAFYQRRGFRVTAYRVGGFADVLRMKGLEAHNPYEGQNGIPIRDLIELEKPLTSAADQPAASPSVRQAPVSGS